MKIRVLARYVFVFGLVAGAWLLGAASYRNLWFPIDYWREIHGYGSTPHTSYHDDASGKTRVDCPKAGPRTFTFIALGQSLASNREMVGEPTFKARAGAVNFLDGRCYQAEDPLLGGDSPKGGTPWTHLADMLLASGRYDHVVVGLFAQGATAIKLWAEFPGYAARVSQLNAEMKAAGLAPDALLWMQGEDDAFYGFAVRTTRDEYMARFRGLASRLRGGGVTAPIYVAEETRCASLPYEPVASAQRDLVNGKDIRRGANIDAIGFDFRWDGCHLTYEGRRRAGQLWRDALLSGDPH